MGSVDWIEIAVGLAGGVVISYLFHHLQVRRTSRVLGARSFSWSIVGPVGTEYAPHLEIRFGDRPIPHLTRTVVALWNAGWETIDGTAIVSSDPLKIALRDAEIVRARVTDLSREATNVRVDVVQNDHGSALISFDFLDRRDGAIIELLHTGDDARPAFHGTLKGVPHGITNFGIMDPDELKRSRKMSLAIALWPVVIGSLLLGALAGGVAQLLGAGTPLAYGVAFFVALMVFALGFSEISRRVPRSLTRDSGTAAPAAA